MAMIKKNIAFFSFLIFCLAILTLAVKGIPGNPAPDELNLPRWTGDGPFETSNDRGRYALLYSVVEDKSLFLSLPLAKFSTPDLAINDDKKYVSLFAPGVSFLAIPGYIIGKYLNISQTAVFFMMSLFALANAVLVRAIAIRLGANSIAASLGALAFIFATPAFAYSTTLYQHHISLFIILLGLYSLLSWNNFWSLSLIWFLFAFSGVVDNPNYLIMFPIALCVLRKIVFVSKNEKKIRISVGLIGALTMFAALIPIIFFAWFNKNSNGDFFRVSGSLERVPLIEKTGSTAADLEKTLEISGKEKEVSGEGGVLGFFKTRNLLNGFYIHFLSPDRGIIHYTPVVLLGVLGISFLYKKRNFITNVMVAIIGITVLLYSMWGDPYGGWTFGSRYLIPVYALLSVGIAIALTKFRKSFIFMTIFLLFFSYSARINSLGALTTNSNPPKIEVLELEKITGKEQKYTEERNWEYLLEKGSKSFVFQTFLKNKISAEKYYWIVFYSIVLAALISVFYLRNSDEKYPAKKKIK